MTAQQENPPDTELVPLEPGCARLLFARVRTRRTATSGAPGHRSRRLRCCGPVRDRHPRLGPDRPARLLGDDDLDPQLGGRQPRVALHPVGHRLRAVRGLARAESLRQDPPVWGRGETRVQHRQLGGHDVQRRYGYRADLLGRHRTADALRQAPAGAGGFGGRHRAGHCVVPLGISPVVDVRRRRHVDRLRHLPDGTQAAHQCRVHPAVRSQTRRGSDRQDHRHSRHLRDDVRHGRVAGPRRTADRLRHRDRRLGGQGGDLAARLHGRAADVGVRRVGDIRCVTRYPVAVQHQHGSGVDPGSVRLRRRTDGADPQPAPDLARRLSGQPRIHVGAIRRGRGRTRTSGCRRGRSSTGRGGSRGRRSSACSSPASAEDGRSGSSWSASFSSRRRSA